MMLMMQKYFITNMGCYTILAVFSLGGFGGRRKRHIWNGPPLWERRARNKKSMILERK
jgi:hypothetical protein